jgi:transcription elongation factor Elf1
MGRRKSKRGPPPKRKNLTALDTQFNCPFCNHERSCEVKMDKTRNTGRIQCTICMEDFQVKMI